MAEDELRSARGEARPLGGANGERAGEAPAELEPDWSREAADELRRAARDALGVVDYTRARIGGGRALLTVADSPALVTLGLLLVGTAAWGVWIAVAESFRDWYVHLGFYGILVSFWLLYVKAHLRRRRVRAWGFASLFATLVGFWIWILDDMRPARRVWSGGDVVLRPELPNLTSIALLLGAVAALSLAHLVATGSYWRMGRRARR